MKTIVCIGGLAMAVLAIIANLGLWIAYGRFASLGATFVGVVAVLVWVANLRAARR